MGPPPGALPPMRMTASGWRITHPPAAEAQGALTLRPARGQHHGTDARAQIDRGGDRAPITSRPTAAQSAPIGRPLPLSLSYTGQTPG
jgi:hypothetical protein